MLFVVVGDLLRKKVNGERARGSEMEGTGARGSAQARCEQASQQDRKSVV